MFRVYKVCGIFVTLSILFRNVHVTAIKDINPESEIDNLAHRSHHSAEHDDFASAIQTRSASSSQSHETADQPPPPAPQSAPHAAPQPAAAPTVHGHSHTRNHALTSGIFIAVVAGCSVAGVLGLIVAGFCWYRLQRNVKAASEVQYPAYGVTGPAAKEKPGSPGDRKLAQSAQMYHYQHQKQQMIAMEKAHGDLNKDGSEVDSEEENEEGDYTVFECPGLAPTGEMEVKNPLFSEDTPVTPSGGETQNDQHK